MKVHPSLGGKLEPGSFRVVAVCANHCTTLDQLFFQKPIEPILLDIESRVYPYSWLDNVGGLQNNCTSNLSNSFDVAFFT